MPLFKRNKDKPTTDTELREIAASVRLARNRLSHQSMPLADLFALVGEDERPILGKLPVVTNQVVRVSPDDVPVTDPAAVAEASFPKMPLRFGQIGRGV